MATAYLAKLKIRIFFDCDQDNVNVRRPNAFFPPFSMHLLCFYSVPCPRLNTGSRNESEIFSMPGELAMWRRRWQLCVVLESLFHWCGRKKLWKEPVFLEGLCSVCHVSRAFHRSNISLNHSLGRKIVPNWFHSREHSLAARKWQI